MTQQTNQSMAIDNTTIIKDNEETVSTLNFQTLVVNLQEYQRMKENIAPLGICHIPFGGITPNYVSLVSKGVLKLYLGLLDTFGTFSGTVTGLTTPVVITANNTGVAGNITLVANATDIDTLISVWNAAHPSNMVTLVSGNAEQVPTADIVLAGGSTYTWVNTDPSIENISYFSLKGNIVPITLVNTSTTETVEVDVVLTQ